ATNRPLTSNTLPATNRLPEGPRRSNKRRFPVRSRLPANNRLQKGRAVPAHKRLPEGQRPSLSGAWGCPDQIGATPGSHQQTQPTLKALPISRPRTDKILLAHHSFTAR